MKKFLLLLSTVLLLTSCNAQNNTSNNNQGGSGNNSVVINKKTENKKNENKPIDGEIRNSILFDTEKIVYEDENVKIAILSFVEDYQINPRYETAISCKVYNKTSSDEIYVSATDMYINDEAIGYECCIYGGGKIKGGKTQIGMFRISKETPAGAEPQSYVCEDLYDLVGIFKIDINNKERYEASFNLSSLKN